MLHPILLAICFEQGHVLLWTDSTSTTSGPPPGHYICQLCFGEVIIEEGRDNQHR